MKHIFLSIKDYEQIKKEEDVLIAVEAKGEPCMYALLSPYPHKINDYSVYENAISVSRLKQAFLWNYNIHISKGGFIYDSTNLWTGGRSY